ARGIPTRANAITVPYRQEDRSQTIPTPSECGFVPGRATRIRSIGRELHTIEISLQLRVGSEPSPDKASGRGRSLGASSLRGAILWPLILSSHIGRILHMREQCSAGSECSHAKKELKTMVFQT